MKTKEQIISQLDLHAHQEERYTITINGNNHSIAGKDDGTGDNGIYLSAFGKRWNLPVKTLDKTKNGINAGSINCTDGTIMYAFFNETGTKFSGYGLLTSSVDPRDISSKYKKLDLGYQYAFLTLSGNQTTNIAVNNHIEFDTIDGNLILSTGAGQADGKITLYADYLYRLKACLYTDFVNNGEIGYRWYDITNSNYIGSAGVVYVREVSEAIITPATEIQVELRLFAVTNLTTIFGTIYSFGWIERLNNG